jgi:hypothetical protein
MIIVFMAPLAAWFSVLLFGAAAGQATASFRRAQGLSGTPAGPECGPGHLRGRMLCEA